MMVVDWTHIFISIQKMSSQRFMFKRNYEAGGILGKFRLEVTISHRVFYSPVQNVREILLIVSAMGVQKETRLLYFGGGGGGRRCYVYFIELRKKN